LKLWSLECARGVQCVQSTDAFCGAFLPVSDSYTILLSYLQVTVDKTLPD